MIPVGYNAKVVVRPDSWLGNASVEEILSVSECISESPIDHTTHWLCNEWLLYDTVDALDAALARSAMSPAEKLRRFFYEVYPKTILQGDWQPIERAPAGVAAPGTRFVMRGYDVVCFTTGLAPECSPLSCNSGAEHYGVNRYCLLDSLDDALRVARSIDSDGGYEPGPYGIMSVWEEVAE